MSALLEIQEKLQDTAAAIARAEGLFTKIPDPSLIMTVRSLEKRRISLESKLAIEAATLGRDLCSYRIIPDGTRARIAGIANVMFSFTFVYFFHMRLPGIVLGTIIAVTGRCLFWLPWYTMRALRSEMPVTEPPTASRIRKS